MLRRYSKTASLRRGYRRMRKAVVAAEGRRRKNKERVSNWRGWELITRCVSGMIVLPRSWGGFGDGEVSMA